MTTTTTSPNFGDGYASTSGLDTRLAFWSQYATNPQSLRGWLVELIARETGSAPTRFLDAGCGTGLQTAAIARSLPVDSTVHAIDASAAMVELTAEHLRTEDLDAHIEHAAVGQLPFPAASFDLVTVIHVLHHVPDLVAAIEDLARVVAPHGTVVVCTSNFDPSTGLNAMHYDAVESVGLGKIMGDTTEYERFAPERADTLLRGRFATVERTVYRNDADCASTDAVMAYYRSAMWRRGTTGPDDPRVTSQQWVRLESEVRARVDERIRTSGSLIVPSAVTAFVCRPQEESMP